ncbi:exopolyphosphatase [Salsipaludibacter albus]|uniref:Ppx/GppA phosphatase family protein n=1 Tax=Salsipaludibacter albus TaxID=2849650 RepID=UPI001EE4956C|nr:exopolyphosphatase [Salsipaludibacter albus]MBY5161893.1 exopolyphosphatase [Salsipaludibacter albus]
MTPDLPRHPAVVDCGSNSTRLWLSPDGRDVHRDAEITRLGRGVDATGHLDDDRLAHCLEVVARYADRWREAGVPDDRVVVIATSAVRDADDRERFFDGIREVAGVDARVLAGEQEATASFVGATSALDLARPTLMVDIGGGSTELVVDGPPPRPVSCQLGSVRLTERHLHADPPTAAQVAAARRDAGETLASGLAAIDVPLATASSAVADLVAVAGTATTLAALDRGTDDLDELHGHVLPAERVTELALELLGRSSQARLELGPLAPGRADVIAAGALVLATLVDLLGVERVTVSIADVLDGVAAGAVD